jgi:hypothetical protein
VCVSGATERQARRVRHRARRELERHWSAGRRAGRAADGNRQRDQTSRSVRERKEREREPVLSDCLQKICAAGTGASCGRAHVSCCFVCFVCFVLFSLNFSGQVRSARLRQDAARPRGRQRVRRLLHQRQRFCSFFFCGFVSDGNIVIRTGVVEQVQAMFSLLLLLYFLIVCYLFQG